MDVVRQVGDTYSRINRQCFAGALVQPNILVAGVVSLKEGREALSGWDPATRRLALRADTLRHGMLSDLLVHEMTHQYLDEVAGQPHTLHTGAFTTIARAVSPAYGVPAPSPEQAEFWPMCSRPNGYYPGATYEK